MKNKDKDFLAYIGLMGISSIIVLFTIIFLLVFPSTKYLLLFLFFLVIDTLALLFFISNIPSDFYTDERRLKK